MLSLSFISWLRSFDVRRLIICFSNTASFLKEFALSLLISVFFSIFTIFGGIRFSLPLLKYVGVLDSVGFICLIFLMGLNGYVYFDTVVFMISSAATRISTILIDCAPELAFTKVINGGLAYLSTCFIIIFDISFIEGFSYNSVICCFLTSFRLASILDCYTLCWKWSLSADCWACLGVNLDLIGFEFPAEVAEVALLLWQDWHMLISALEPLAVLGLALLFC